MIPVGFGGRSRARWAGKTGASRQSRWCRHRQMTAWAWVSGCRRTLPPESPGRNSQWRKSTRPLQSAAHAALRLTVGCRAVLQVRKCASLGLGHQIRHGKAIGSRCSRHRPSASHVDEGKGVAEMDFDDEICGFAHSHSHQCCCGWATVGCLCYWALTGPLHCVSLQTSA